jgi:hypothetical protein
MFRVLPPFGGDPRAVAEILNGAMNGKTNNTGTITLATGGATTTTLYDARISAESKIILIPFSAAAFNDAAPYGSFSGNADQAATAINTPGAVAFDTTEESNGVTLSNTSRINVANAGIYNVQYSLQLANYDNAAQFADVWFRVNNNDIPRSASRFDLPARKSGGVPSHIIGTVNIFLDMTAGQYFEIYGAVSDTDVKLEHYDADNTIPRPAIPTVICTVQYIAPQAYSNVYVSAQSNGQATITHWANSTADKTYGYVVIG